MNERKGKRPALRRRIPASLKLTTGCWYYANIEYQQCKIGLLVGTGDESTARREAEEVCASFGDQATLLSVERVVLN